MHILHMTATGHYYVAYANDAHILARLFNRLPMLGEYPQPDSFMLHASDITDKVCQNIRDAGYELCLHA